MVAYSFKPQFVAPIVAGTKRQTIRADRKRHARRFETLQLYTGMRTKHCRLIGVARCLFAWPIRLDFEAGRIEAYSESAGPFVAQGDGLDLFARSDGFDGWPAMRAFWREAHGEMAAFSGVVIGWDQFSAERVQ